MHPRNCASIPVAIMLVLTLLLLCSGCMGNPITIQSKFNRPMMHPLVSFQCMGNPITRRESDGAWLYDMGFAFVSMVADSPTRVILPEAVWVKGVSLEYISGSGTCHAGHVPLGNMGDARGTLTTVYIGNPPNVLVPDFTVDARRITDIRGYPPGGAEAGARWYSVNGIDLAGHTGSYDLYTTPRELPRGSPLSIWNSDWYKSDNRGGTTMRWYLILTEESQQVKNFLAAEQAAAEKAAADKAAADEAASEKAAVDQAVTTAVVAGIFCSVAVLLAVRYTLNQLRRLEAKVNALRHAPRQDYCPTLGNTRFRVPGQ
jgi:hypothetical protein